MEALNGWDNDIFLLHISGPVAQWLEQGTHKPKVVGSNPTRAIYYSSFINLGEMAEWSKAIDC